MHHKVPSFAATLFLLMLTTFTRTFSQPETQTLTLLALKSSISLDPTRILSTWIPSDPSPCSWHGVSCSTSGEVTSLSLPYLQLHGYLPSVLSLLSSLQILNLSNNNLTGEIYVTIDEEFTLELEELLRASAYVVGKSKSGIVYKVVVGRGPAVAVRRLSEGDEGEGEGEGDEWKKRRIFEAEAMAIGRANHPNVVRLRAYYYAPDEKLLIYDYISNGTFHSALHGGQQNPTFQPLPWATRLAIIQGAARGLAFLHECTPRKYIHGNIKSTKILLDDDLQPYISGFGLTRLLSGTQKFTHSLSKKSISSVPTTSNNTTSGHNIEYLAPEARVPHTPITQKCDVYSFGIVMLEALTGRLPNGELEDFVRKAFKEEGALSDIVDPALLHEVHAKKQVLAVFHVALGCTEFDPEFRPRMKAVSESLERI